MDVFRAHSRLICSLVALLTASCGNSLEQLRKDIAGLKAEVSSLKARERLRDQRFESMTDQFMLVKDEVESNRAVIRHGSQLPSLPVVRVRFEPSVSEVDEAPFKKLNPTAHIRRHEADTKKLIGKSKSKVIRTSRAPETREPQLSAISLYKRAFAAYKSHDLDTASKLFTKFIQRFPDHSYADNSYYWLGEVHYDHGQYAQAIQTFKVIPNRYPLGNKIPDALLKIGFCYERLNDMESARKHLYQVVEKYPLSDAAKVAIARVQTMRRLR